MRGMLLLRGALLGLAVTGLTALAQSPAQPAQPTTPTGGTPTTKAPASMPATPATTMPVVSPTQPAATVNGEAVFEVAVQRALERVHPSRRADERPRLINYLVDNLLIDQSLRGAGYTADPKEVDKRIADMKAELKKVGKDFEKMLGELKVSEAELKQHIGADLRWFKYASAQATDKALADLFATNKDMFDGTMVRARHILLSTQGKDDKATAGYPDQLRTMRKAIMTEVDMGLAKLPGTTDKLTKEKMRASLINDTFMKMAREKSDCPSKNTGGDLGYFGKVSLISAPFANAAFQLQPMEMSDAVKTTAGYHLILVTERNQGKEVKFDDVKEIVKEVYFDRLHDGLAAALRQKASITIHPAPK